MSRSSRDRRLKKSVACALAEDRFDHDRTTRALHLGSAPITARVTAQASGVLSGILPARLAAEHAHVTVVHALHDGRPIRSGEEVLRLRGPANRVFGVERTVLNYLMHLSGVATATARTVRAVNRSNPSMEVWGTRKTVPGLRHLEKDAIVHGGGRPHRRDLEEGILVKNTHLKLLPLPKTLVRLQSSGLRRAEVEVEVRTSAEALLVARAGVRRLLIDNASPDRARAIVDRLERAGLRDRLIIELSGGITPENASRFARAGADAVSLGAITHSAKALPFHLEILASRRPLP
jgi:nicotinate-nucleotide pyrophosphorylase (carboxylating)